ncbi:hypothetical protein [Streptomyces lydicus]|uniref:hypothetical protein n=1 Tax=Streptomyces lydicus TaxID=47763 RepID=UPI00101113F3|nr:hypothetical protein [Streptomyces lydicus]MCZ1008048.1 hypothetical protein [Streptomyces lydicus]
MKRKVALSLGAAILSTASAGLISATPAAAASSVRFYQVTCSNMKETRTSWSATCHVPYGHARANIECRDGSEHYGAWMGRGTWKFGMTCGRSAMGAMDVQTRKN